METVSQYERGTIFPSDEVVLRMAEAAGQQIVCYWHLLNKSRVAGTVLPDLRRKALPEAVLSLLVRMKDFQEHGLQDLLRLAADGRIDQTEVLAFGESLDELREMIRAAYECQYAETE